ncbi:NYN domain-containing protein [Knoellia locipacati]|uniref:Nuclease n=1 Tax=Knoellia locipacati TaxID=882824 RepID=A0A512T284_9MICO|nr:NYN domain-containing protein [Knoellia locipacati]GEQ14322.1 nuclease [Knoellia locipacati]
MAAPQTTESDDSEVMTYLLVDGENIDATLGTSILGRRPQPDERPRWDRLIAFAKEAWSQDVRGLFFLNASTTMPMSFIQALNALGFQPVPLSGDADVKVVDVAIQRTLRAIKDRDADVMLVSHDGDFLEEVEALLEDDDRRVGLMAFREFRNSGFTALEAQGLESFDLEYDVKAFTSALPRIRVIPIDEFDPAQFL